MERKFYTDDFERLLKEKSDEFKMYPSKRVWSSIYNDLHPGRKWPSVAVSLVLIFALFITGYWNSSNNTNSTKTGIASISNIKIIDEKLISPYNNLNHNSGAIIPQKSISNTGNYTYQPATPALNNTVISAKENEPGKDDNNNTASALLTQSKINTNASGVIDKAFAVSKINSAGLATATHHIQNDNKNKNTISNANPAITVGAEAAATPAKINVEENNYTGNTTALPLNTSAAVEINGPVNFTTDKAKENSTVNNNTYNKKSETEKPETSSKATVASNKAISAEDRAWMDDYAMYNKSSRNKWKDRLVKEFYITPGIGFRKFSNNSTFDATAANTLAVPATNSSLNAVLNQKPGIGFEAGIGLIYSLSKKLRVITAIQANYTSYTIYAEETNHPVLTTLRLTDINTGYPYLAPRTATLSNASGLQTAKVHNKTYQVSIPVGLAVKLAGNDKLEWYAGVSIQPTFVIGGKANLISDDRKNYVSDASLLRRWNLNSGFETYINYKFDGLTLQLGPQFRYQLLSTYSSQYTLNENLYNAGLKIGILKNF